MFSGFDAFSFAFSFFSGGGILTFGRWRGVDFGEDGLGGAVWFAGISLGRNSSYVDRPYSASQESEQCHGWSAISLVSTFCLSCSAA